MSFYRKELLIEKFRIKEGEFYCSKIIEEKELEKGIVVRNESWARKGEEVEVEIKQVYYNDLFIGGVELAIQLIIDNKIRHFEKRDNSSNICTIGYSEEKKKWFGWSHRGICGFGIGTKIGRNHNLYVASGKKDFLKTLRKKKHRFVKNPLFSVMDDGVDVSGVFYKYPEKWGRGKFVVKDLQEAKELAKIFAKSVA